MLCASRPKSTFWHICTVIVKIWMIINLETSSFMIAIWGMTIVICVSGTNKTWYISHLMMDMYHASFSKQRRILTIHKNCPAVQCILFERQVYGPSSLVYSITWIFLIELIRKMHRSKSRARTEGWCRIKYLRSSGIFFVIGQRKLLNF